MDKHQFMIFTFAILNVWDFSSCQSTLVDLSYTYNEETPNHPKLNRFTLRVMKRGMSKYGYWLELNDFCSSEHSGTHIDAPLHFDKDGKSVDLIQLDNLYRIPGVLMDMRDKTQFDRNYKITVSDLEEWTSEFGDLPDGCVILFRTGRGAKSNDLQAYSGLNEFGNLNNPGLGKEAAEWIVNYGSKMGQNKGVLGVGLDVLSLDIGKSLRMPAHVILLGHGLYGLENVANLHLLPRRGFTLTILPMKIGGGSGGPTRILAEIGGEALPQLQSLRLTSSGNKICRIEQYLLLIISIFYSWQF